MRTVSRLVAALSLAAAAAAPGLALAQAKLGYVDFQRAITEVDEGGSVPELLAKNSGIVEVIILEGEEVRGAKQNRIRIVHSCVTSAPGKTIIATSSICCANTRQTWQRALRQKIQRSESDYKRHTMTWPIRMRALEPVPLTHS